MAEEAPEADPTRDDPEAGAASGAPPTAASEADLDAPPSQPRPPRSWVSWVGPRLLLGVGWGLCFSAALNQSSAFVLRMRDPTLWERFLEERWILTALAGSLPCLAAWLWLVSSSPPAPRPAPPRSWAAACARGLTLAALLSLAFTIYLACGGHDIMWIYGWTPVGNAALVAPLLGLLSMVETREAEGRRKRLGWALLLGLGAFVALLVAWVQREYVNELFVRGLDSATSHVVRQLRWLAEDPLWTAWHFAWIGVPLGALTYARLGDRGERGLFALGASGAVIPWVVPFTFAADAVIAPATVFLCLLTPLAWRLGDRLQAKAVERILDREP